ncbi:general transcription factor 3C polypeptide 6-like isoform X2 [Tubulanus polymorphus]|uniref:general transcription factor 3C polypeptide 6-like isoform X2 n=1 Tax=Tubulanus polymorphus TaxID=672921 RepID=UPI003DA5B173
MTQIMVLLETLVVMELAGVIDKDFLYKAGETCTILNLDGENPLLEIGGAVYSGEYKDTVGSNVLFEEEYRMKAKTFGNWNLAPGKSVKGPELEVNYYGHTHKKLVMNRVFLTPKGSETEKPIVIDDDADEDLVEDDDDVDDETTKLPENVTEVS